MKEKWELFRATLSDEKTITKREFLLTLTVCALGGILLGILFSPKKRMVIGCNNGNYSGKADGCGCGDFEDDYDYMEEWDMCDDEFEDWDEA